MCSKQHIKIKISSARNVYVFWKKTRGAFCAGRDENTHQSVCGVCQRHSTYVSAVWGSHIFKQGEGGTSDPCPHYTWRVNGCCYYLVLAAVWCEFLCPLRAEGRHQKTDPSPISFAGMNVEQLLGAGEDLAIQPCCTPGLPRGRTLCSPEQNGCCHNQTLIHWSHFDSTTTWKPPRKRSSTNPIGWPRLPRKVIITCDAGIMPPSLRIFVSFAHV